MMWLMLKSKIHNHCVIGNGRNLFARMQEAAVPDVTRERAIEHHEDTHTSKEKVIKQVEENSGHLHAALME